MKTLTAKYSGSTLSNDIIDNLVPKNLGKMGFETNGQEQPWYIVETYPKFFYDYIFNSNLSYWLDLFFKAVESDDYMKIANVVRKYEENRRRLVLENLQEGYEIDIYNSKNADVLMKYFKEFDKGIKLLIKSCSGKDYLYYIMPNFKDLY